MRVGVINMRVGLTACFSAVEAQREMLSLYPSDEGVKTSAELDKEDFSCWKACWLIGDISTYIGLD